MMRDGRFLLAQHLEVNETIQRHPWDCATLRREMIGARMMVRGAGVYWRLPQAEWRNFADAKAE